MPVSAVPIISRLWPSWCCSLYSLATNEREIFDLNAPLEIWLVEQLERINGARDVGEIGGRVHSDSLAHDGPEEFEVLQYGLVAILTVQLLDESLKSSAPLYTFDIW